MGELEGLLQAYIPSTGVPRPYFQVALEQHVPLDAADFKEMISFASEEMKLSPEEIAARCDCTPEAVGEWLKGTVPGADVRQLVCKGLYALADLSAMPRDP